MNVTKSQNARHRVALVTAATALFQQKGFAGTGVAEIAKNAGLTQGGLYAHFPSKDALMGEACKQSHQDGKRSWIELRTGTPSDAAAYLRTYLSEAHLREVSRGCPMAAYGSQIRSQSIETNSVFTAGFEEMVDLMMDALIPQLPRAAAYRRALALVSGMTGSLAMARATERSNPSLAKRILKSARTELERLAAAELLPEEARSPSVRGPRKRQASGAATLSARGKASKGVASELRKNARS